MLYHPERHQRLCDEAWDEDAARRAITEIAADAEAACDPREYWPAHPLDDIGGWLPPAYFALYSGAAGVIWALDRLARAGAVPRGASFAARMDDVRSRNRALLEPFLPNHVGYLQGDVGVLLAAFRLAPRREIADRLWQTIRDNLRQPSNELMLGVPGTLLAACFLYEETGEARFAGAVREGFAAVWDALGAADEHGCRTWRQRFLGRRAVFLSLVHGFAGNVAALLRAAPLLSEGERSALVRLVHRGVQSFATVEGGLANWPGADPADASEPVGEERQPTVVQICYGAPGVVVGLRGLPKVTVRDDSHDARDALATEDLLARGGELVWQAGPLAKGAGLCHGTAGNGYALLALHARSHEERWLQRARAFAMHAIGQWRAHRQQYGRGRYSLWTGDLGLALYLWDCIRGEGEFPTIDVF